MTQFSRHARGHEPALHVASFSSAAESIQNSKLSQTKCGQLLSIQEPHTHVITVKLAQLGTCSSSS